MDNEMAAMPVAAHRGIDAELDDARSDPDES